MKYKITLTTHHEHVLPYHWEEGDDRLEWQSPNQQMRELLETLINGGHLSRYVGPDDSITRDGINSYVTSVFNTLEGINLYKGTIESFGGDQLAFSEVEEIPEA